MIPHMLQQSPGGLALIGSLAPAAWFRYGVGITVTGAGVSQWDDQSGNGRHLKQGTDTNRPALQADYSILFDGADNFLKCDAFTLDQPETVYLLMKQPTWTNGDVITDGDTVGTMRILQGTTTPRLYIRINSNVGDNANTALTVDTYGVVSAVFDGASSSIQVNNGTITTGDVGGTTAGGGFTLGANATPGSYANAQVKEAIVFASAHDADTRARVIRYLAGLGAVAI